MWDEDPGGSAISVPQSQACHSAQQKPPLIHTWRQDCSPQQQSTNSAWPGTNGRRPTAVLTAVASEVTAVGTRPTTVGGAPAEFSRQLPPLSVGCGR